MFSRIRSSSKGYADLTSIPAVTEDIGTFALAMSELYLCEEVGTICIGIIVRLYVQLY